VQLLEAGTGPEGITAIPSRRLIAVAAEKSGTLHLYRLAGDRAKTD
jgi:hypothetical protein